jgi:diaminobutyrate-2-oxoglutarate transaminase
MSTVETAETNIYERRASAVRSYCRSFPVSFAKAEGSILTDAEGNRYIDFLAGCSSLNYGHNDPDMKSALIAHVERNGIAHGLDLHTEEKAAFLETFEHHILTPRGMDHRVMMVGPTGTNAVEAAIKLARKVTGRRNVIAFTNGFHGMTLGALALTGNRSKRAGAGGVSLPDVTHRPYENSMGEDVDTLAFLEATLNNPSAGIEPPAAFVVELVQGEGGLNAASCEWVQGLARIAKEHGALLIIDDIQAGMGRTGSFFSFDHMGVEPDMVTLAKSLSGFGLPFACVLVRPEHDIWKPSEHNGTFRGNSHAFVTAKVALEKFWADDTLRNQIALKSQVLEERLHGIASRIEGARIKGRGMMRGVDVGDGELADRICAECFRRGLIIETSGARDEVVKVLAALTIPMDDFRQGLDILEAAVEALVPFNVAAE